MLIDYLFFCFSFLGKWPPISGHVSLLCDVIGAHIDSNYVEAESETVFHGRMHPPIKKKNRSIIRMCNVHIYQDITIFYRIRLTRAKADCFKWRTKSDLRFCTKTNNHSSWALAIKCVRPWKIFSNCCV